MNVNARIEGTTIYVPVDQIDELRAQLAVEGFSETIHIILKNPRQPFMRQVPIKTKDTL